MESMIELAKLTGRVGALVRLPVRRQTRSFGQSGVRARLGLQVHSREFAGLSDLFLVPFRGLLSVSEELWRRRRRRARNRTCHDIIGTWIGSRPCQQKETREHTS
jgi:hypothetical protein